MRFSQSTHLLMFLTLKTLMSIIKTGLLISNDLTQMVNFPTQIPDCDSHSPALLDFFLSSDTSICSTMAFSPLEIQIMLLSQFPLTFHEIHNRTSRFIILVLIGMVFMII